MVRGRASKPRASWTQCSTARRAGSDDAVSVALSQSPSCAGKSPCSAPIARSRARSAKKCSVSSTAPATMSVKKASGRS